MRIGLTLIRSALPLIVLHLPPTVTSAEEASFVPLTLSEHTELANGTIGGMRGVADSEQGERIVVGDLSIMQPVLVALLAADAAKPLEIELVKTAWDQPVRSARTDDAGVLRVKLRTQESFGIRLRSLGEGGAGYSLLVWAGEEVAAQPPSIFAISREAATEPGAAKTSRSERDDVSTTPSMWLLVIVALACGALGAAGVVWFARRRRSGSTRG